jgi:predicted RNA binding protein YcfA (HicA-like mRNA interferase family)
MAEKAKLLEQIVSGRSDANVNFNDLVNLLDRLGFEERIRGSHHIFVRSGIDEILNLQPKGAKAKVYQVRQVRRVILKYGLGGNL